MWLVCVEDIVATRAYGSLSGSSDDKTGCHTGMAHDILLQGHYKYLTMQILKWVF
jgi:hypothetical protein